MELSFLRYAIGLQGAFPELFTQSKAIKSQTVRQGDSEMTEPDSDEDSLFGGDDAAEVLSIVPAGKFLRYLIHVQAAA